MLNPKITIKHYKIYLSCSNVSGVQVEPKHKLSKGIHSCVMKYTRRYDEISTADTKWGSTPNGAQRHSRGQLHGGRRS